MTIEFTRIEEEDVLNTGRQKLNNAIEASEYAYFNSGISLDKAKESLRQSTSTQEQLDQLVIEGDSSVEAAQARVDANENVHTTLKGRADSDYNELTQERDQVGTTTISYENELVSEIITPTKTVTFEYNENGEVTEVIEQMKHKTTETVFTRNLAGIVDKIAKVEI